MGDYFQIIADVEATQAEAQALAESVVRWLAGDGIIMPTATDCVLGAESGYPPGPRYDVATTVPSAYLLGLRANGLEVSTDRQVFHPGQGELAPVRCPRCDPDGPAGGSRNGRADRPVGRSATRLTHGTRVGPARCAVRIAAFS